MTKEIKSKYKVGQVVKYEAFAGKKFGLKDYVIKDIYWWSFKNNEMWAMSITEEGMNSACFVTEKSLDEYNK